MITKEWYEQRKDRFDDKGRTIKNSTHGVAPDAKRKSNSPDEPVAKKERAGSDVGFRTVLITSYRLRLLDERNLYDKYFVDCLVKAGLLRDDSSAWCKVEVGQIKVSEPEDERTVIVIQDRI
jgi:hypothetical protein